MKSLDEMTDEELAEHLQLVVERLGWVMGIPVGTQEQDFITAPLLIVGQPEMVEEFLVFYDEMLAVQLDTATEKRELH